MENNKPYVIACAVLALDIKQAADRLGLDIGLKFLEGGLHERPDRLRKKLQAAIDKISASGRCSRIAVGYGVCGRGTVGIRTRDIPLAIPKVHDCIALFLGGDAAYQREFKKYPGTYYLSAGWYEEKTEPLSQRKQYVHYGSEKLYYDDLVEQYGEDAAQETFRFLSTWRKNYQRAAFIETGAKRSPKYETYARSMAAEYGWKYEKIAGDQVLLEKLLRTNETTAEILVVPPQHVIGFDALQSTLAANPVWTEAAHRPEPAAITLLHGNTHDQTEAPMLKIGLGIDAGGTYTDTVLYDLEQRQTLCKSKALTTKWDFTVGITAALAKLDQNKLRQAEMVALSTTLATNAIVEGEGHRVGLIIMPPYGLFEPGDIRYEPKAVIAGQLDIKGRELRPLDEAEVKRAVRRMVEKHDVKAFAVSGYAGAVNPAHEMKVKKIIRAETGLFVTCGHELSNILNFKTRAHTAMLNARIFPRLAKLLLDLEQVLETLGIDAPMAVVKGDGTLMSSAMAKERPVETILSGPAASVAGARHLTGLQSALVVDMGGTTTDTAALEDGAVSLCETGSNVGGHKTHVQALEIRTVGLGGDSAIEWGKGRFHLGPGRVAPLAWLGATYPEADKALAFLKRNLDRYTGNSRNMQILALSASPAHLTLTPPEEKIVACLTARPYSLDELMRHCGILFEKGLQIQRLEEEFIIQRCGLTPTDLLHVTGRFQRWDTLTAEKACRMLAHVSKMEPQEMAAHVLKLAAERLTLELLKRQLDDETDPEALHTCAVCQTLLKNLLAGGNDHYRVRIGLKRPVVGIGAPIHFFLPQAAAALGAKMVLPEDADVANAIGAITSNVMIRRQVRIVPNQLGGFLIEGLAGNRYFSQFEEADAVAREALARMVRDLARAAGTSARLVELTTEDQIPTSADGSQIFIGRTIHAKLTGRPDLVMMENHHQKASAAN